MDSLPTAAAVAGDKRKVLPSVFVCFVSTFAVGFKFPNGLKAAFSFSKENTRLRFQHKKENKQ